MQVTAIRRLATEARSANWTLANGAQLPKVGFGTWKSPKGQVGPAVQHALKTGYRHLDLAWAYRNEDEVGDALKKADIKRDQLWLTSKLWNSFHKPEHVEKCLDATLKDLGVDYLDLWLMHWPVAFLNQNGAQVPSVKSQDGKPIEDVELSRDVLPTWEAMEEMVKKGKVRNLGISNFNIRRTEDILRRANVKPLVNQVEVNWGVPNDELLQYSRAHDVMLEAYSPLGSNTNIAQYLEEPVVQDVAKRNKLTPAQVLLAWPLARGIITLPKSVTPSRIEENFKVMDVELPQEDVELLLNEAQKHPINRTVNPVEAWGVKDDIYEDGIDQRRLGDLKGAAYTPAAASQSPREHRLEPNNRSFSTQTAAQARARAAGMMSSSSFSERATVLQNKMAGKRAFSTSQASSATAEAQPSSQEEAPIVRASPILRTSAKDAIRTPGLAWKDGEEGVERETRKMNMYTAIRDAQSHALASDETAVIFGEDVNFGGVFRTTMGLAEEFGKERVFNTPLTEQGIAGFGVGMAAMGHTAIAEIQFADYIFPAFDQLVNEAAKMSYRSGGTHTAGKLTVRAPCMGVGHGALYHSQSVEQFFMPAAGLKIVIPRSPIQAKGLLLASIRDPNPVVFLEPKVLYRSSVEQVPVDDYTLPLSSAEILLPGQNITLLSWGAPLYTCAQAIDMLRSPPASIAKHVPESVRKAEVELIDLRTILPWDRQTVAQSVMKTGRCVIVHEAPMTAGAGAEMAAELQKKCFLRLEAPINRIGGWDTPFPHVAEAFYKPDAIRILDGLVRTLTY